MLHRQTTQEGVQIPGYGRSRKAEGTSKGWKRLQGNEDHNTQKLKGQENGNWTENRGREKSTQAHSAHEDKREKKQTEEGEGALNQDKKGQEDNSETGNGKKTQGPCKPKAEETLRVVITDPEIQAYRDHMINMQLSASSWDSAQQKGRYANG